MIFHAALTAHRPQRVAGVIAELWGGHALPVPAIGDGAWIAITGDTHHAAIEIRPHAEGDSDAPCQLALATPLSSYQVCYIARCQDWAVCHSKRGDGFAVIELWIENRIMIEVLTPPMQRAYQTLVNAELWQGHRAAA